MKPGPSRNVQSLSAASETASVRGVRRVLTQAHDPEHEDDAGRDEGALDETSGDVAEGKDLVLPPEDRVHDDSGSDVRDDEQQLQERPEIDLVVLAATGDVAGGVVENRLVESESRDRRDERDEEEHSEDPSIPLILFHVALLPVCSRSGRAYPVHVPRNLMPPLPRSDRPSGPRVSQELRLGRIDYPGSSRRYHLNDL